MSGCAGRGCGCLPWPGPWLSCLVWLVAFVQKSLQKLPLGTSDWPRTVQRAPLAFVVTLYTEHNPSGHGPALSCFPGWTRPDRWALGSFASGGFLYFRCGILTSKSRWFYNWVSHVYHFSLFYSTYLWDREVFRCGPPVCGKDRPQTKETGCHSPGNTVRPFQTLRRALCLVWMEPFVHDEGRPWGEYSDLYLWKVWKYSREHVSVGSDKVYINSFLGWNREICGLCASAA